MFDAHLADRFVAAVRAARSDGRPLEPASTRRSPATADALRLARQLGLADSVSAFSEGAVITALESLAHGVAVEIHYQLYPEDRPSPVDLAVVHLDRAGVDGVGRDVVERAAHLVEASGVEATAESIAGAVLALQVAA